jgi:hypothetical protein
MKLLTDIESVFGKISPPPAISNLTQGDPTGAKGISTFLSNFVVLIFSISAVVLLFMVLWGAFDWIMSEGDKEKLANAQKKLINAFIGIIILSIAFAVISVLGTFTGFRFFEGQGIQVTRWPDGTVREIVCPNGARISGKVENPEVECKNRGY